MKTASTIKDALTTKVRKGKNTEKEAFRALSIKLKRFQSLYLLSRSTLDFYSATTLFVDWEKISEANSKQQTHSNAMFHNLLLLWLVVWLAFSIRRRFTPSKNYLTKGLENFAANWIAEARELSSYASRLGLLHKERSLGLLLKKTPKTFKSYSFSLLASGRKEFFLLPLYNSTFCICKNGLTGPESSHVSAQLHSKRFWLLPFS